MKTFFSSFLSESSPGIFCWSCVPSFITAAFSGRAFDQENPGGFFRGLGLEVKNWVHPKQVHGNEIVFPEAVDPQFDLMEADAVVTNKPEIVIGILTADCIPAFFWSEKRRVIALAHAGWRGLTKEILTRTVDALKNRYGVKPEELSAAFGPFIRSCCYEVGEELKPHFGAFYTPSHKIGKGMADLLGFAQNELIEAGLASERIFDSAICTSCENKRFFSARREKTDKRILSILTLR